MRTKIGFSFLNSQAFGLQKLSQPLWEINIVVFIYRYIQVSITVWTAYRCIQMCIKCRILISNPCPLGKMGSFKQQ